MRGILDQYVDKGAAGLAQSIDDVFGIALARALGDTAQLDVYKKIAADYSHLVLADAAKRLLRRENAEASRFAQFYRTLTHDPFTGSGLLPEVVALKVELKVIGVAAFNGPRVTHTEIRNLGYANENAARTAGGLVRRLAEDHPQASFVLDVTAEEGTRRAKILDSALGSARDLGLPLWTFGGQELLDAFGIPSCRTRDEMRESARNVFAHLELPDEQVQVDALAAGLLGYCRLLLHQEDRKDEM